MILENTQARDHYRKMNSRQQQTLKPIVKNAKTFINVAKGFRNINTDNNIEQNNNNSNKVDNTNQNKENDIIVIQYSENRVK